MRCLAMADAAGDDMHGWGQAGLTAAGVSATNPAAPPECCPCPCPAIAAAPCSCSDEELLGTCNIVRGEDSGREQIINCITGSRS